MRILQVCSADGRGGGERHVADLTRALAERGHQLHLAVRPNSFLPEMLRDCAVIWHEIPLQNAVDIFSVAALRKIIRTHNIEIVHAHVARDYPVCGYATKNTPAAFFITRHHFHPVRANPLYTCAIHHVCNLIGVSDFVAENLRQAFPSLTQKVIVIPNWIEVTQCGNVSRDEARQQFGITRQLAMGLIGQITPLKRQDWLIRAATEIVNETAYKDVEFLLIGEVQADDAAYFAQLQQMMNTPTLRERIRFISFTHNLSSLLSAFDIVVVPSENEAFSLSLVEAMSAGCAVVASAAGALREIVRHEKTGLLFPVNDYAQMLNSLKRLLDDQALRKTLGENASIFARERFRREQNIEAIEQCYFRKQKDR